MIHLLDNVPDFCNWTEARRYLLEGQERLRREFQPEEIASLGWSDITAKHEAPFGYYSCAIWRKFVLATFLADLVSYEMPVDQVNFARMLFVMHAFPTGFRTWWVKLPTGKWWPVGYSGWYPMLENHFELFEKYPQKLLDRMVVPKSFDPPKRPYLYLFNYSVQPSLKKSCLSRALMKQYVEEVHLVRPQGLACITVSEEGASVAKRFGMSCSGYLELEGVKEGVYTGRI